MYNKLNLTVFYQLTLINLKFIKQFLLKYHLFTVLYLFQGYSKVIQVCAVLYLVTQSCLTLWNTMGHSLPGSSVHGDSPGKHTGVGCHAFLQGIFPTQVSNPSLLNCRWILYWNYMLLYYLNLFQ